MEKTEIYAELPAVVSGVTIIPVVKVTSICRSKRRVASFSGLKHPVGVIIISSHYQKSFDMSGEEVPLEHFIQEVPGLKMILENY